jgi:hypothetical protein
LHQGSLNLLSVKNDVIFQIWHSVVIVIGHTAERRHLKLAFKLTSVGATDISVQRTISGGKNVGSEKYVQQ